MSGRKPALPGVQRDVDALLSSDPAVPAASASASSTEAPAASPRRAGDAANDAGAMPAPSTVAEPKPLNGAHGPTPREIDRAALMGLASQFPSAGTPPRPANPPGAMAAGPAAGTAWMDSGSRPAAEREPPAQPDPPAEPRGNILSAGAGMLDRALFGSDPMRRWATMAVLVVVGLVLVVLLEAAFLSAPSPTSATAPGAPGAPAVADDGREAFRVRLAETQARLDAMEAAARETARTVAALRQETAPNAAALATTRVVVLATRLEALAATGRPFAVELAAARAAAGSNADLAASLGRLEPFAETGIPTRRDLATRVSAQAPRIAAMAGDSGGDGVLGGLFSRKPSAESVTAAILTRAQAELENGDLGAAVRQLQRLPGAQRQAAQPWITAAERRVALDAAIAEMTVIAFQPMVTAK